MLSIVNDTQAEILNHLSLVDLYSVCYTNKTILQVCQSDKRLSSKLSVYRFVEDLKNTDEIFLHFVKDMTFQYFTILFPYASSIVYYNTKEYKVYRIGIYNNVVSSQKGYPNFSIEIRNSLNNRRLLFKKLSSQQIESILYHLFYNDIVRY